MAINHEQIEEVITPKTKGILPVHMLGLPAEMDAINEIAQKNNLWVVEDCAHAPGAKYKGQKTGSLGSGGAFSFYPGKNIGALGEAGIITTDNDELANLCRSYRDHGSTAKFEHNHIGINGRLDGIQAAMLRVKLPHLDGWNRARQKVARAYNERLANTPIILPLDFKNSEHVYHVYAIRVENRDEVFKRMQEKGIGVNIHYPVPMHLHPGFSNLGYQRGDFINAEICADETLSLPCFPEMTVNQIDYVSESLKTILSDLLQEIRE
jgi:dTDP-4-amino-4,6-dideoxygalactose transaminase